MSSGLEEHFRRIPTNIGHASHKQNADYLSMIMAGKMKPIRTAAVAPVNWNASQMLGMKLAAR